MKLIKINIRTFAIFAAILPMLFLSGCNSDGPVVEQPEKVYYDLAQRRMQANNFFSAIEALQAIESRYPFGHAGVGGAVAFGDPEKKLGYGFVCNQQHQTRGLYQTHNQLVEKLYAALS